VNIQSAIDAVDGCLSLEAPNAAKCYAINFNPKCSKTALPNIAPPRTKTFKPNGQFACLETTIP
jgi:hypothetical protein